MTELSISGAGLAGTLLAISLARRGFTIDLYERRPDPRRARVDFGRSINLALSARGAHALERAGLLERVLADAVPMRARAIHSPEGRIAYQPFGRDDSEHLSAIERHTLNATLLDAAEAEAKIRIHFEQRLLDVDVEARMLTLRDERSGEVQRRPFRALVGADGAFSSTRRFMVERGVATFSLEQLAYGYKELPIAEAQARDMRRECLHLWPRRSFLMIANPNPDASFSATLFLPLEGAANSFASLREPGDVTALFREHFPDALDRMPTLTEDFFARPVGTLPTVRGGPWHVGGKVLLLGDAAHAKVPFFAQGMNSAFEDVTVLLACLDRARGDLDQAFEAFSRTRPTDTDAVAGMAMQNYREIQDHIADTQFLFRKRLELELMRKYPGIYTSMHVLVMFTLVPYAFARACGARQARLLDRIAADARSIEHVDWNAVERALVAYDAEIRHLAKGMGVELFQTRPRPGVR